MNKTSRTKFSHKILLLIFSASISLLLAEAALKFIIPYKLSYMFPRFIVESVDTRDKADFFTDSLLGPGLFQGEGKHNYRLRRNMVSRFVSSEFDTRLTTNDLGFRGAPYRKDAYPKVLALGDSFTMGFGVDDEDTYPAKLEVLLQRSGRSNAQVLNGGVLGYNPYSSYYYLLEKGIKLKPDIVILQLWTFDDIFLLPFATQPTLKLNERFSNKLKSFALSSHLTMAIVSSLKAIPTTRLWMLNKGLLGKINVTKSYMPNAETVYKKNIESLETLFGKIKRLCDEE